MKKIYDYQRFPQYNHIRNITFSIYREFDTFNKLSEY